MKIALYFILCVSNIVAKADEFNSSALESKMLGNNVIDVDASIKFVASVGEYSLKHGGYLYSYTHLCSAILITPQYLASAYYCYQVTIPYAENNYEKIRTFIGDHNLNFEVLTPIYTCGLARHINGIKSLKLYDTRSHPSYYSVTFIRLQDPVYDIACAEMIRNHLVPTDNFRVLGWSRRSAINSDGEQIRTHKLSAALMKIEIFQVCEDNFEPNVPYNGSCLACGSGMETADRSKTQPMDYGAPVININDRVVAMIVPSSLSRNAPNYFLKVHNIMRLVPSLNDIFAD